MDREKIPLMTKFLFLVVGILVLFLVLTEILLFLNGARPSTPPVNSAQDGFREISRFLQQALAGGLAALFGSLVTWLETWARSCTPSQGRAE